MTNKDVALYIKNNFAYTLNEITEISSSQKGKGSAKNKALVICDKEIYDFDLISESIHGLNNKPASSDGLFFTPNEICFVEFKTGFRQIISRKNFDKKEMGCPRFSVKCGKGICPRSVKLDTDSFICDVESSEYFNRECFKYEEYCPDFADLFLKDQKKNKAELKTSIRMKAIEGYITFEKWILPKCQDLPDRKCLKIKLIVVIDENGENDMMAINGALSNNSSYKSKDRDDLYMSLKKYQKVKDAQGNDLYYDEIVVMSPDQFRGYIENILK